MSSKNEFQTKFNRTSNHSRYEHSRYKQANIQETNNQVCSIIRSSRQLPCHTRQRHPRLPGTCCFRACAGAHTLVHRVPESKEELLQEIQVSDLARPQDLARPCYTRCGISSTLFQTILPSNCPVPCSAPCTSQTFPK